MIDRDPSSEPSPSRYGSLRDETLHLMSLEGWANETSGDVESPTGCFSRVSNLLSELPELEEVFSSDIRTIGLTDSSALLGHFLIIETGSGLVRAVQFDSESELLAAYYELDVAYMAWAEQGS